MLRLPLVEADDAPAINASFRVGALYPVMACSGDPEVERVDAVGNIEPVVLFVPMASAALDNLDARPRLGCCPTGHQLLELMRRKSLSGRVTPATTAP